MWGKIMKHNHMLRDITIEDSSDLNRTRKVFAALYEICLAFDLEVPQWLDGNIAEFGRISRTRFTAHNFYEEIPFDYLEIQVIEEDI
jgi:hypothetical protein